MDYADGGDLHQRIQRTRQAGKVFSEDRIIRRNTQDWFVFLVVCPVLGGLVLTGLGEDLGEDLGLQSSKVLTWCARWLTEATLALKHGPQGASDHAAELEL